MKLNITTLKKYLKCSNYAALEEIYFKKKSANVFMTDDEIEKLLNVMYTEEGQSNVKDKLNTQENTYNIYKTIFKKWILEKNIEKTIFDSKIKSIINLNIFECDIDCLLEEDDNIYIIQNTATTLRTFCKKMNLISTDLVVVNDEIFKKRKTIFSLEYKDIQGDYLFNMSCCKFVYEQSCLYNKYKNIHYYMVFLDEEEDETFSVVDFTFVLNDNYYDIPKLLSNAIDMRKELKYEPKECVDKRCKFNFLCNKKESECIAKEYINIENINKEISNFKYPIYYLDFESYSSPYPRFEGEKPYSQHVFMYSLIKKEDEKAELQYEGFIAKDNLYDYRRTLFEDLISKLKNSGTIIVYNDTFEKTRIKEAIEMYPDLKKSLQDIIDRMYDLLYLLKGNRSTRKKDFTTNNYYNSMQRGSYSLKTVLPLFTKNGYQDLDIQNGIEASECYSKFHLLSPEELEIAKENLVEYCNKDVLAMDIILQGILEKIKEKKAEN